MIEGRLLVAYHGCDITTRDDLVSGKLAHLDLSKNPYDWLGPGAYFFEGDAERALMFANASHNNPMKMYTARPIGTPAVVGAVLSVQRWLDMTTQEGIHEFTLAYPALLSGLAATGSPVPKNAAASEDDADIILRKLDNAVFTFIHDIRENSSPPSPSFQAVRGAFYQGAEVAPKSGFRVGTHVQIALRDNDCVEGWFLARGDRLLTEAQYLEAVERREQMARTRKPRGRV
ncbi:hypothetical protein D0T25_17200 [Duganella sp. BJB488]|uniref:hypothetical protein n=1 Tax=unclassified Duganella TaxID=2636909 RepID=UPI000E348C53|nr:MULTISPECIES: hypothetical protein [unclassified Duganella]NVD69010.1 hypothetical protein [Duganella sp. BJB1802]RFP16847.1 hypothetical protein D0T26_18330 [Duganella sp. BJB489]RFP20735.1 hypothetical protein D0T25_17200 [Duganella sp. BJB488]RFP32209.1 hypothetical protein D0T24_21705 [Duganella sp. BJB480]